MVSMPPTDRLLIRVETLATVEESERWEVEASIIRQYKPPFNAMIPADAATRKAKWNAFCRSYLPRYYAAHPEKAAAKREADKLRARARRAAAKEAKKDVRSIIE